MQQLARLAGPFFQLLARMALMCDGVAARIENESFRTGGTA